ncbi:MAG: winged helix DNA-binding protein [Candidatus Altiarchaeales archaeon]|nr:winged helix DNA-binding protein [Candidatus Altiarchaeales archaeon]
MEGIARLLLHDKPSGIILSLRSREKKYAAVLAKENDCTYTHVLKILDELKGFGLVEFEKEGRIKFVKLTEAGEDVAHELEGLVRYLEKSQEKIEQDKKNQ